MTISPRRLDALPAPRELRRRCISLALLDEMLSPDWECRYYSFDSHWAPGALMASMRNGSGDDYFIGFSGVGVFIKGFAHESPMSPYRLPTPVLWPGVYDGVPQCLGGFRHEPAFCPDDVTFCIWWDARSPGWRTGVRDFAPGDDPDGSVELLAILDGDPMTYKQFAEAYYEIDLPSHAVDAVYRHLPLTSDLIRRFNSAAVVEDVLASAAAAGYGREWSEWGEP